MFLRFDLFDEDDFIGEDNKVSNQITSLRLIHSNTRSRSSDNRVASMDKILDDMRKKFETDYLEAFDALHEMKADFKSEFLY